MYKYGIWQRLRFIRLVSDCNMIPSGYGVAWYDDYGMYRVAMPLGVNWIAGFLRHVVYHIGCGYKAREFAELRHQNEMLKRENEALRYLKRGIEKSASSIK